MDRINATSQSMNTSDINQLYGLWIKDGNQFVEQETDFWHPRTRYYAPIGEPSFEEMKELIARELMEKGTKDVFDMMSDIQYSVRYVPVIPLSDNVFLLYYDSMQQNADLKHLFHNGKIAAINNLTENWDWKEMDTNRINDISKKYAIFPINRPFTMYNEMLQNVGSYRDNPKIYYLPIASINCTFNGNPVKWSCACGKKCILLNRIGNFPEDPILKDGILKVSFKSTIIMMGIVALVAIIFIIKNLITESGFDIIIWLVIIGIISIIAGYGMMFVGVIIDSLIVDPIIKYKEKKRLITVTNYKKSSGISAGFPSVSHYDLKFGEKDNDITISLIEKESNGQTI